MTYLGKHRGSDDKSDFRGIDHTKNEYSPRMKKLRETINHLVMDGENPKWDPTKSSQRDG